MAATAVAQPRTRPARAPARPPVRILRTATAISDAADSRLIVRLTRSQAWIAIVGVLLAGIVALNVYSLGMGSVVSSTAERAAQLERENSLLREQIGKLKKNGEIEQFAAKLGLGLPSSEELSRLVARDGDAKRAAQRLKGESIGGATTATAAAPVVATDPALAETDPLATEPTAETAVAVDPATAVAADPTTTAPAETAPAETAPVETAAPAATAPTTDASPAAGGIAP